MDSGSLANHEMQKAVRTTGGYSAKQPGDSTVGLARDAAGVLPGFRLYFQDKHVLPHTRCVRFALSFLKLSSISFML